MTRTRAQPFALHLTLRKFPASSRSSARRVRVRIATQRFLPPRSVYKRPPPDPNYHATPAGPPFGTFSHAIHHAASVPLPPKPGATPVHPPGSTATHRTARSDRFQVTGRTTRYPPDRRNRREAEKHPQDVEQRGPSRDQRRDAVESHGTRLERCHRGFSSAGEVNTGATATSAAAARTTEFYRSNQSDRVQFSVLADARGDDGPFTYGVPLGSDVAGAAGTR